MSVEKPPGQDLQLDFWVSGLGPQSLQVAYEVVNVSDSDIFLFNVLHRERTSSAVYHVDANLVYVFVENDVVHVTKRIAEVPDDVDVPFYDIPCATLLRRGDRCSETLNLPLPLRPFHPYARKVELHDIRTFGKVAFSLGYYRAADLSSRAISQAQTPTGQRPWVYVSPANQLVVRADPIRVSIPVMV